MSCSIWEYWSGWTRFGVGWPDGLVSTVSRRPMAEWECLKVAKASLGKERTKVLEEIQGTIGDQT
jgi:hypothetical protein